MAGWRAAMVPTFAVVAAWRVFVLASLVLAVNPPAVAGLAVAGQVATAALAALGIARGRVALAKLALAGFFACVAVQMGADAFVYGFRSLVEALAGLLVAGALALLGWLALRAEATPVVPRTL